MKQEKGESLREFYRGHFCPWQPTFTLACIRVVLHQHICRGHKNLFYRKYSVGKRNVRLMNNVKRENVRESRILNSCECSDLPNLNIA